MIELLHPELSAEQNFKMIANAYDIEAVKMLLDKDIKSLTAIKTLIREEKQKLKNVNEIVKLCVTSRRPKEKFQDFVQEKI